MPNGPTRHFGGTKQTPQRPLRDEAVTAVGHEAVLGIGHLPRSARVGEVARDFRVVQHRPTVG